MYYSSDLLSLIALIILLSRSVNNMKQRARRKTSQRNIGGSGTLGASTRTLQTGSQGGIEMGNLETNSASFPSPFKAEDGEPPSVPSFQEEPPQNFPPPFSSEASNV